MVLQLGTNPDKGDASVTSVTEYLLTQPILSFTVSSSAPLSPASDQGGFSEEESEEEEEEEDGSKKKNRGDFDSRRNVVMLKLHCVHTRCAPSRIALDALLICRVGQCRSYW